MATTPNYGWVTPAPTDFVVDLPADFETFADAVDADLAGLLGGTTGQVLTKDSNADHDFSWQSASSGGQTLISTTSLSGGSVTLSSIPNTYRDLKLVLKDYYPTGASNRTLFLEVNGTQSIYQTQRTNDTEAPELTTQTRMEIARNVQAQAADNICIIDFPNYVATDCWKMARSQYFNKTNNDPDYVQGILITSIRTTSAISSITIVFQAEDLAGGTAELWGLK